VRTCLDGRFGKPLSAVAMGCAFLKTEATMAPVLDAYVAAGGTIFDTAPRYGAVGTLHVRAPVTATSNAGIA